MKQINILKNFLKSKKVSGIRVNTLRSLLENGVDKKGPVVFEGRAFGCVNIRYKLKCKSSNCFLIQKEINQQGVGHQNCHACHLAFLKAYEADQLKVKK